MDERRALANKPISIGRQLMYSFSDLASNPIYTIMMSFLTFFYTDVLGVNPALIGTLLLFCKVFDGVTDIAAGSIVERTHTKNGSARPWVLRTMVPLSVSLVLLFTVPNCGTVGKLVYIFISYNFAMSVCYTMFGAAINAMPIYATNDPHSRGAALACRLVLGSIVQLILATFFMNMVDYFGGDQKAWIIISAILAAAMLLGSIITYFSLHENANPDFFQEPKAEETAVPKTPVIVSLKALLRNKYWLLTLLILTFVLFHQIATLTVGVYYATWVLNDTLLAGKIALYHSGATTVAIFFAPVMLNKGMSKQTIGFICTISMLIGGVLGMTSGASQSLFYASLIFRGAGFGVMAAIINAMLADTLVYGEWKTGVATPAIGMCAFTFAQKIVTGLVTAGFTVILGLFGYDGLVSSQPASAIRFINLFFLYFPVILYVGQLILLRFYKLDKELPQILADLDKRHAGEKS